MERLTERHYKKTEGYYVKCSKYCEKEETMCIECERSDEIVDRLGAIEDILGDNYDLDRLRKLAQREGISPCTFCRFNPPSSGDGKPCCMCPAEAALRREQDG